MPKSCSHAKPSHVHFTHLAHERAELAAREKARLVRVESDPEALDLGVAHLPNTASATRRVVRSHDEGEV